MKEHENSLRGFAAMNETERKKIASLGGKASHAQGKAHKFTPEEARCAGSKGGKAVSRNAEHMAKIGRKGGQTVSQDRKHMARIGRDGGKNAKTPKEKLIVAPPDL